MKSPRPGPFLIISTCSEVSDDLPREERRREEKTLSSWEQDDRVRVTRRVDGVGKYLTFAPGVIEAARQEPLDNMVVFRNQNLRLNFHHHHLPNTIDNIAPGCDATITG